MAKEITGYVVKEEQVSPLTHNVVKNTFVLDVSHPFPGFYGDTMRDALQPSSVLFITPVRYSWEKILRASAVIQKFLEISFIAGYCEINIGNQSYYGIRVNLLPSYDIIENVQHAFMEEGFEFKKVVRIANDTTALIKVQKFFHVKKVHEGLYLDTRFGDQAYIIIPEHLNWELFRKITYRIKNNISNRAYDVVEGVFYTEDSVVDMIRVYKPKMDLELLKEIQEKYLAEIKRYI